MPAEIPEDAPAAKGSVAEVLAVFLKLGLTSFGGPIAHLAYFRDELVVRRKWITEAGYADVVGLSQFLPGPASSKVGFTLGLMRGGGLAGGFAAWLGFTLPSALVLFGFALSASRFEGAAAGGFIHGLKLVAVAIVAQAIWGMARTLTPDRTRIAIAAGAFAIVIASGAAGQIVAIAAGALLGLWLCRSAALPVAGHLDSPVTRLAGGVALVLFALLLIGLPLAVELTKNPAIALFDAFYRSGALVFGGGHVLLPLLQAEVVAPGWISDETFLAGYGLTQAVPGPLFTFAAYLGAAAQVALHPAIGATIALVAVFLPGGLLAYGVLPFWDVLRSRPIAQAAMRGANAAVVGILAAAFYNPVWSSAIFGPADLILAVAGFLLLTVWKAPSWSIVLLLAGGGTALGIIQPQV